MFRCSQTDPTDDVAVRAGGLLLTDVDTHQAPAMLHGDAAGIDYSSFPPAVVRRWVAAMQLEDYPAARYPVPAASGRGRLGWPQRVPPPFALQAAVVATTRCRS